MSTDDSAVRFTAPGGHEKNLSGAPPAPAAGLSNAEADRRRAAGHGNNAQIRAGRSYLQIVVENVFNFINNLFYVMGALLLILGKPLDAVVVVGVITANTVISLVQEIRAKRVMDRIAILMRPRAIALRDGELAEIDPASVVVGDLLYLRPGDQVVVDGPFRGPGVIDVDESLLTGESDHVRKRAEDNVLSGSFCVAGSGYYEAEKVGTASFANKLMAKATKYKREQTPLQRQVSRIVRALLLVVVVFETLVWIRNIYDGIPFVESVRMSTVILALIPNGLVLSIALTYALGAMRLLGQNVVVQRFNAIESLSNVDVLCTDKTGTLTTGVIRLEEIEGLDTDREAASTRLAAYAASTSDANGTIMALREALPSERRPVRHEISFSSARKWSALQLDGEAEETELVFGAPEVLAPALNDRSWQERADEWARRGLRVLLLAGGRRSGPVGDENADLPENLRPLALVSFSDELRPGVHSTLDEFTAAGIEVKVISGDNPATVAALATQAGLSGHRQPAADRGGDRQLRLDGARVAAEAPATLTAVAGPELVDLADDELDDVAERSSVFGRVTPEQKEDLVRSLRRRRHYVAMIGDGVNDVIALKQANVAVGMQGGSQAARGVSDLVLLNDTFAPLPFAFREGQRIINGMNDILKIFLVRIIFKAGVIAAITAIAGFPFAPRQASLVSFVTAGVPAVALAAWARTGPAPRGGLFRMLARFVVPTAVLMLIGAVIVYLVYALPAKEAYIAYHPAATESELLQYAYPRAQTALTLFSSFCGIFLLLFAVPPVRWLAGGAPERGDWRIVGVVVALVGFVAAAVTIPLGRLLFELERLPTWHYYALFGAAIVWGAACQLVWHSHILDRWLGTNEDPGNLEAKARAQTARAAAEAASTSDAADATSPPAKSDSAGSESSG